MKYIAYCRKSTDEKERQVLSIDAQVSELQEFAKRGKLEIVETIIESKTAKSPGREKFAQVLQIIEAGKAQGILSWHPDRLARNSIDGGKVIYLLDTGKLLDLKFPSFWFENTPQGKFMLSIAFGQSKYYVDNLSENVKRGIREKLRRGIWPKQAPLGYVNNPKTKEIDINPEQSKIIKKAFQLFATERKSFTQISDFLFKMGVVTSKGKPLKVDQVKNTLTNTFYIGTFKFNGEYYQGTHKCFITKELFKRVQEKVHKIERPRVKGHHFAFGGLMKCGECGASITAEHKFKFYKRTNRKAEYIYYRCTKKLKPCQQKYINEPELEKQFRKAIDDVYLPKSWGKDWYDWLNRDEVLEKQNAEENIKRLEQELVTLEEKLNKLLDGYLEGIVDPDSYKTKKNEFFEEKIKIQEEISQIQTNGSNWLEPFREWMNSALSCAKIARAKNTCEDLAIFAKTVGSNFFLTNRQLAIDYKLGFRELRALTSPQSQLSGSLGKSHLAGWNRIGLFISYRVRSLLFYYKTAENRGLLAHG